MQKQQQKVEETASSSSSSSSFLEDIENNITVDLTKLNIDQLGVFNRLIAKVDDHRHVCNRVAFKHLIDNLDKAVKEEEMKEKVEEETKEEVEEETKEESVSFSSFSEESQSDIIDLIQLHVDQLELFHHIIEIADEVDDLRHVRINRIALKHLFDNLDDAVEEEEEVEEEEVEEEEVEEKEEVEEEEGETEEESVSSYFLEEIHDNIIIDLTRIRVDELGLFYRIMEIADETDDLKHVSINRIAFNCLIYNFDEGLDEEEEEED